MGFGKTVLATETGKSSPDNAAGKDKNLVGIPGKSPFADIRTDDPNLIFITYMNQREIIKGFPNGTYHPAEGLSRAQAAVIICQAAGISKPAAQGGVFTDLPLNHWAAAYIEASVKAGYIKGFTDHTFQPDKNLTRAQAISLIMRLSTQKERAVLPKLQDMDSRHWAASDMATALALQMIELSPDGKNISPEAPISRGSLARALAILLTQDPGLNRSGLSGTLTEVKGEITLIRNGKNEAINNNTGIYQGDTIKTGANGTTRIVYPDGSGILLEENSELAVKQSDGRSYIKQDGTCGTAVELLNISLKQGALLGALAAKRDKTADGTEQQKAESSFRLASRNIPGNLAVAGKSEPWYQTAEKKKVKMKVDMPWGVSAIRGTFFKATVKQDGSSMVSCLTGNVDVTSSNGAGVVLGGSQSSSLTGQASPPTPVTGLTPAQMQQEFNQSQWLLETALQMDLNQEAPIVSIIAENPSGSAPAKSSTSLEVIIDALRNNGVQLNTEAVNKIKEQLLEMEQDPLSPYQGQNLESKLQGAGNNNVSSSSGGGASYSTFSNQCEITAVNSPAGAVISGKAINATVANNIASINVDLSVSPYAIWNLYSDNSCTTVITGRTMTLAVGANTAYLKITAQNTAVSQVYTLNITRSAAPLSNNAKLSSLTLTDNAGNTIALSPSPFDPDTHTYDASVANSVYAVIVTAVTADPLAALKIDGNAVSSASSSGNITLTAGALKAIPVMVTAQDGSTILTYTVNVTRAAGPLSSDATLYSLATSVGTWNIAFSPGATSYTVDVPTASSTITITPAVNEAHATVTVNGSPVSSGSPSSAIALSAGATVSIAVTVTAQDGSTRTYTLVVVRRPSGYAFTAKWGEYRWIYSQPRANALDSAGNIYISDKGNNKVHKFSPSGSYITSWAAPGAVGIAVYLANNHIYVTDQDGNKFREYDDSGSLINEYGGSGSGNGQLSSPWGIAVDQSSGHLFIADWLNHRIQEFDSSGNYQSQWGVNSPQFVALDSAGNIYVTDASNTAANNRVKKYNPSHVYVTEWGGFSFVEGIAVSNSGWVYVADSADNNIKWFDTGGVYQGQWGTSGSGDREFQYPMGVSVDASGNIYVTELNNYRLQKFHSGTAYMMKIELITAIPSDGKLAGPAGVVLDAVGRVLVADGDNCRIQVFDSAGGFISKWGSKGSGNGQFDYAANIALDSDGNIYIPDAGNHRIQKFDPAGNYIAQWGGYGSGNGQFNGPDGIAVDSTDNIYVVDSFNNRIQKFNSAGVYQGQWGVNGTGNAEFDSPYGIVVDHMNNVYVADQNNQRIQKFDANGNYITQWGSYGSGDGQFNLPGELATDAVNNIYVSDDLNNRVQKFSSEGVFIGQWGSHGSGDGQFDYPEGIVVDSLGNVYVVDSTNGRIQKFAPLP